MSVSKITTAAIVAFSAASLVTRSVQAVTMEQSQSSSQSMEVSVNTTCPTTGCTGTTTAKASGQQSSSQVQRIETDSEDHGRVEVRRPRVKYVRPVRTHWVRPAVVSDGQVRLNWGYRGGSCQIRYGETARKGFAYTTSASCDDGGITIGGLKPGVNYRFQVKPENGVWSKIAVVKAE